MYIPYGRQWIEEDDIQAVTQALKSDYLTTGPRVEEFERYVADYVGAKYAVAVSNGTAALHAACYAAGIGEGDEVITSPITFVASANSVLYCGAKPVFADIDPDTYNIDPAEIRNKITPRTKAIIPVHFTGQPCDMDKIREIALEHNLIVIEDAAHALGADYKGKQIGSISEMTTFSFHPVKHITTGEGGMIMTDQKELYERLLIFRSHGITRDPSKMTAYDGAWYYQQIDLGFNYRITDVQCALGLSQMKKLDLFIRRRREIAVKYNEAFRQMDGIKIPFQAEGCHNSWHLYVVQVLDKDRQKVFDGLTKRNIGVNVHYIPVYTQPYYRNSGYADIMCSHAERAYARFISLPMYAKLTDHEQDYVIEQVKLLVQE